MRIISGRLGGRRFDPPAGPALRPTTDQAREALFNILAHRIDFAETEVLDLFAGGGGISMEFASRGCPRVVAVEKNPRTCQYLTGLCKLLQAPEVQVVQMAAEAFLACPAQPFSLVFLDPPYAYPGKDQLLMTIQTRGWLAAGGLLILEHSSHEGFTAAPGFTEARSYGQSTFSFFAPGLPS
jgi:16S rRNA (guanine966-N2)-methyltransferase